MSDLNNCAFTGIVQDKQDSKSVGSSTVTNFTIEAQKILPDGKVIRSWPRMEAWGTSSDKMSHIDDGSLISVVGEYQVRKDKSDGSRYYHTFNVRQVEDLGKRE